MPQKDLIGINYPSILLPRESRVETPDILSWGAMPNDASSNKGHCEDLAQGAPLFAKRILFSYILGEIDVNLSDMVQLYSSREDPMLSLEGNKWGL